MTKIEILNADFNMTIDKFMKVMWSNNDFWLQVQKEQGLFDLEFGETKLKLQITMFKSRKPRTRSTPSRKLR